MKLTYNEFRDYLKHVSKLHALTSSLIKYYDNVIKHANGKYVHELSEDVRNLVLGGLNPDGEYTENAYALFIKDFTGLGIEDPKLYVSKLKLEAKPTIKVTVEESRYLEFVRLLNSISKFILYKAEELNLSNINVGIEESNIKQQNIENLIAEVIKTSYDLSVGINSFSTSIWGLRKITPHYMKKAYENMPETLLKSLGFSQLVKVKDYEIRGFPDYFTKCMLYDLSKVGGGSFLIGINGVPVISTTVVVNEYLGKYRVNTIVPETLGGAICMMNEVIWRYIDLLQETLSKWYKGIINLEERYIEEAWKSLDETTWSIPDYLRIGTYKLLYAEFKEVLEGTVGSSRGSPFKFLFYDEDGIISKYTQWVYRGSYERSGFDEYKLSRYILLPELFDDLMPAIFLGVIDITLYLNDKKTLLILVRTKGGG